MPTAMGLQRQELIGCRDCGNAVSFSAFACPHCGSREPSLSYEKSRKERRLHRIEQRNDQTMISMTVLCTGVGFFLGALIGGTSSAVGYAVLGAFIGIPAAFVVNLSRRLFG